MEAYVVYLLHKKDAYDTGVEEERFISEVQEWYQQKEGKTVDRDDIVDVVNNLYRIKVTDINNGVIYLKEHVWGVVRQDKKVITDVCIARRRDVKMKYNSELAHLTN